MSAMKTMSEKNSNQYTKLKRWASLSKERRNGIIMAKYIKSGTITPRSHPNRNLFFGLIIHASESFKMDSAASSFAS
jgi:hypothetical protein